jgi:hypothetical protein
LIPPENEADQAAVLREVERQAAPFQAIVIKEGAPSILLQNSGGFNDDFDRLNPADRKVR